MIETIYSEGSVEANGCKNGKGPDINVRLPKNIRQIGQGDINMNSQIYIEESVLMYIKKTPEGSEQIKYGVLLGERRYGNGYMYIFINGIVEIEDILDHAILFSDDIWTGVYDSMRRYYKNTDIVGWYAYTDGDITKDMPMVRKIHMDHFAGGDKTFFHVNGEEDEECFYIYERNSLRRQPCYHVYFDKSVGFEDYLYGTNQYPVHIRDEKKSKSQENFKYGISLNKNRQEKEGTDKSNGDKENSRENKVGRGSKRIAYVAAAVVLIGAVGVVGRQNQLGKLNDIMKQSGSIPEDESYRLWEPANVDIVDENLTENIIIEESTGEEPATTEEDTYNLNTTESESTPEQESTTVVSVIPEKTQKTHVVKDGETLYSISVTHYGSGDMVEEIVELNHLTDENVVYEGQKIFLP